MRDANTPCCLWVIPLREATAVLSNLLILNIVMR